MTDAEQIEHDRKYSRLKLVMDESESLGDFDSRVGGATARQTRLFVQYKKLKHEQIENESRIAHRRSTFVVRHGKHVRVKRDARGRFTK